MLMEEGIKRLYDILTRDNLKNIFLCQQVFHVIFINFPAEVNNFHRIKITRSLFSHQIHASISTLAEHPNKFKVLKADS